MAERSVRQRVLTGLLSPFAVLPVGLRSAESGVAPSNSLDGIALLNVP